MKIGIDIGGNHISVAIIEEDKIINILEEDMQIGKIEDRENFLIGKLKSMIDEILIKNNRKNEEIELIGIAVPGITNNELIIKATNIRIYNFEICKELKKYYDTNIQIMNDAKCAAIAEKKIGALKEYKDAVFLTIGTGIGGAVFINGKLLRPSKNDAFEIGHMVIDKNGVLCNCGRKGCFEKYASMQTLKDSIKEAENKTMSVDEIYLILKQNKLQNIIDNYLEDLSIGLENLINIFEPEAIAFGGSFSMYEGILVKKIEEKMKQRSLILNENMPIFISAELQNNAGIIGATYKEV